MKNKLASGRRINYKKLTQVGKGQFSRCYALDSETVLLESYDPIKKLMADGLFPKHRLFPEVKHFPRPKRFADCGNFYTMTYYDGRPKRYSDSWLKNSLEPSEYLIYRAIYDMRKQVDSVMIGTKGLDRPAMWNDAFASLPYKSIGKALIRANNLCNTVGESIMFDCMPKNVATYKGKLILLDCFYSSVLWSKIKNGNFKWAIEWKK